MDDQVDRSSERKPPIPRWVKVFAAIALLAIIALLVLVISGGEHGPGRHIGAPQPAHQHA